MKHSNYPILIAIVIATFSLTACSPMLGADTKVAPPGKENSTGPFLVEFKADTKTYEHVMNAKIDDEDGGGIQYFLTTPEAEEVQFVSTELNVTGCPSSQVSHKVLWLQDGDPRSQVRLVPGAYFRTHARVQGIFIHYLEKTAGCQSIELKTVLKLKPKVVVPAPKCKESTDSTCVVQVACEDSRGPGKFLDVEVWKESWGVTLRKFAISENGNRSLTGMHTVHGVQNGSQWNFTTPQNRTSLKLDTANRTAAYTDDVNGQVYTLDLVCESYL